MLRKTLLILSSFRGSYPASMRPQQNAAEDAFHSATRLRRKIASMRPQQNAAEDTACKRGRRARSDRFNEAAAKCCGRPYLGKNHGSVIE